MEADPRTLPQWVSEWHSRGITTNHGAAGGWLEATGKVEQARSRSVTDIEFDRIVRDLRVCPACGQLVDQEAA